MRFFLGLVAWLLVPILLMNAMGLGIRGLPSYLVFFFLPASVCLIIYQVICRKNRSRAEVRIPLGLTWFIISGLMALLSFKMLSQASPGGLIYETDLALQGQYFAEKGLERATGQRNAAMSTIVLLAAIGYYRFLRQEDLQKEGDTP